MSCSGNKMKDYQFGLGFHEVPSHSIHGVAITWRARKLEQLSPEFTIMNYDVYYVKSHYESIKIKL